MDRYKYRLMDLKNRFNLSEQDIGRFIEEGLLLPWRWFQFSHHDKLRIIANDFEGMEWENAEVERFEKVIRLVQKHYDLFTRRIFTRLDDVCELIRDVRESSMDNKILLEIADLKRYIDKKDMMIDLQYFMDLTGYKESTIRNATEKIDDYSMYLKLNYYRDLTWVRRVKNGKWQLPLIKLEEVRKGMPYEIHLVEDQRTGRKDKRIGRNIVDII